VCAGLLQVLHGGENLLDKVEALKARSAATKAELEVAARQKEEQQRRLEQLQLERLDLNTQYSTLEVGGKHTSSCRTLPRYMWQEETRSLAPRVPKVPPCLLLLLLLLQEEVTQKSKQLKALYSRYRARRAEAADLQAQFQVEREDLLADYRALSQQIKLKNLAIAAFIPPAYQDLIMARCAWNEYEEQWVIAGVEAAGEGPLCALRQGC
jgi:kinesin family protein 3/17